MRARAAAGLIVGMTLAFAFAPALEAVAAPELGTGNIQVIETNPNDGNLESGESAGVGVELVNHGSEPVSGIHGTLTTTSAGITVTDAGPKAFNDMEAAGGSDNAVNSEPFTIAVASDAPCPSDASFTLAVTSDQGASDVPFTIPVSCAAPFIVSGDLIIREAASGDVISIVTEGVPVEIEWTLTNAGTADADHVTGHVTAPAGAAEFSDADHDFGAIPVGGSATGTFAFTMTSCVDPLEIEMAVEGAPTDQGSVLNYVFDARCAGLHFVYPSLAFDDSAGDGDGFPEPGETISITIGVESDSSNLVTGIESLLDVTHATVVSGASHFPDAEPGARVSNETPFVIRIDADAPTITLGEHCALLNGVEAVPTDGETAFVNIRGTLHLTAEQGSTDLTVGTAAVCAVPAVNAGGGNGEPLAETGVAPMHAAWFGTALIAIGLVVRRRVAA